MVYGLFRSKMLDPYLTGLTFSIETNHKPLIPILTAKDVASLSPPTAKISASTQVFRVHNFSHIGKEQFDG